MLLATVIVIFQLIDSYIRWLALSRRVSEEINRQIGLFSLLWGVVSWILYQFLFLHFGINCLTYKFVLMVGWLPYFLICMKFIPIGAAQHIFILGMGTICSLVQHTLAAIIILLSFEMKTESAVIFFETATYLLLFVIFFPICNRYFLKLLPSREFFDVLGMKIAVFPLIIVSSHIIRLADDVLIHSWAERLSRIYLPVVFFFFYRYILMSAKNLYDLQRLERNKKQMEEQITILKSYNEVIQTNQEKISTMKHDLRHRYSIIYGMLDNGDVSKARDYIDKQKTEKESD